MKRKLDKARQLVCLLILTGALLAFFGKGENLVLTPRLGMMFAITALIAGIIEFVYRLRLIEKEEQ